ncbi:hypothetical protein [Homoserinibacter sp. YIM 151385]|uniref:hypothetical protein n=1 Tax=Homoserinibacter sp. YIM 151385 TaxID=2985506 RepID=UPI0022F12473|nr:hypothetical protein [Homoserinibacter sp. YIM 151385]WBU37114.1 hypothetical protein OF852_09280 [Homoserinibacter sp. YIM 151385]
MLLGRSAIAAAWAAALALLALAATLAVGVLDRQRRLVELYQRAEDGVTGGAVDTIGRELDAISAASDLLTGLFGGALLAGALALLGALMLHALRRAAS